MSTAVAVIQPAKEGVLLAVTPETLERFKGYLSLRVEDIHDNKALKVVHDKKMELVRARTSVDKARKAMNEDAKKQIEENNKYAKEIIEQMAPVEAHLEGIENSVELAREAVRVEVANKVYNDRVAQLKAIGVELPEPALRSMSADGFDSAMIIYRAQAIERDRLALIAKQQEEERAKLEAEQQAERERQEADQLRQQQEERDRLQAAADKLAAERESMERQRLEQQAAEDKRRQEEAAELDRQRAELEEAKRKQDEETSRQQAELDRQLKEIADQRAAQEKAESERLAKIEADRIEKEEADRRRIAEDLAIKQRQEEMERAQKAAAEKRAAGEQAERERVAKEAEGKRLADEAAAAKALAEQQQREALQPDLDKLSEYIAKVAKVKFPAVSDVGQGIANDVEMIVNKAVDEMRARIEI